ncbi:FAD-dependent oxidoreductase [Blastomonas sp. CCH10-E1]|uniref:FAD-dependent oxidoreductase n=1 Tax=Blastomonas sp. CCH10-E1 TaxID=1768737 RepID=UPI0009EA162B|nr:FAD-dependent oxidoreductase [Blastomonas sp. CCH10-E1]
MEAATVKGKAKGVQPRPLPPALRITFRVWLKLYAALIASARPLFDLAVRLIIAQGLLASGLVKLMDWERALTLASQEYPVSFLSPPYAAALGLSIELGGAVLLALGLMTRGAALAVGALMLVAQLGYLPTDTQLFTIALMGWYAMRGAGALSLDRLLARGLKGSAVPLAPLLIAAGAMPLVSLLAILGLQGAMLMGYGAGLPLLAMATLGLFIAHGSGRASIDAVIAAWLQANVLRDAKPGMVPDDWPHVVIVGGGFGGLACALALRRLPVRITLIDRQNYHLFQPLLYQIATAALSPADVAIPIRQLFRADGNVRVLLGEVDRVDAAQRTIGFGGNALAYDYLVLATGATHSYFGRDDWAPFAPGLKRVEDAIAVRAALLGAFEKAESCGDPARARRLLTFVIIGAGPTGVELAGAIAELARHGLEHEYRSIDPADARVILVQAADRILPAFPPELSAEAAHSLERLGVEIRLDARVTGIEAERVLIGEEAIESETVLWAAGVAASPAGRWLNAATDPSGRVTVDPCLRVAGQGNVFVIGDAAASLGWQGKPVPGLAPAAKQAGQHVARLIGQELRGKPADAPFIYRHQGSLATIGRKSAIADFGWLRLHGAPAWWLWGAVHIGFLAGFRNRAAVIVNWLWSYATQRAGIRLITMGERG